MAADAHAPTASEYIVHHLQHLQNIKQKSIIDFSVINLDSIVVSATLGVLSLFVLWLAARKATSGVPGRFQAAVELLVEMVDNQAKANIHNAQSRKFIAPLALTVFVWIFMRSEEHTSELQSPCNLVCRLLLEKKKNVDSNV